MSNVNLQYSDRVRYTLKSKNLGALIITEPIGWQTDEKEYARHETYHGIIARFSNSLKFVLEGADFIQLALDLYGINEQLELIRDEKHPQTDIWTLSYSGYLDLSTWTREKNQISVKFNSGGIEQLLKSRESEKVEIDRLTTIDGKQLPELNTINVELDGRRIFLKSKWKVPETGNMVAMGVSSSDGNTRFQTAGFPLTLENKSQEQAQDVYQNSFGAEVVGNTSMMFLANFDRTRNINVIAKDLSFFFRIVQIDIDAVIVKVCLSVYSNGINYNLSSRRDLFYMDETTIGSLQNRNISIPDFNIPITVNQGDSIALEYFMRADLNTRSPARCNVSFFNQGGNLFVEEDSFFEKSKSKSVLAHELADRLVSITTNKQGAFYSDFLGRKELNYPVDGKASLTSFAHGFWVRNFDKLPIPTELPFKVENLFKPLTTSFKEFADSMNAVWNVGVGIENIGSKERVRIEHLSYFYSGNVTIRLKNQVKNVKRTIATDKYYSALEFGYKEGGDYEEAFGLDEFNAKSNFTTIINRIKNTYSQLSEYRADSYGMEFTRRKPVTLNNTEDTPGDNSIWFLDLKRGVNSIFKQRKWQDDFQIKPTGVFSPETATNLRFSPINNLLRHSWWFSGGFKKYLTEFVRYGSSTANSQLKTKLIGSNEYAENGNIINSELMKPRFLPEEIEFEYVCDFDVMQQVNGTTTILGKKILNFYGLVEFTNERNEIEKGYLMNLKPNGKGTWRILKANR